MTDAEGTVVRVVVVDDQAIVRTAVKTMLTGAGIEVIGEAEDGESAVDLVTELAPEVVVMDLGLPGISGIEATRKLATVAPVSRVLVLTGSTLAFETPLENRIGRIVSWLAALAAAVLVGLAWRT